MKRFLKPFVACAVALAVAMTAVPMSAQAAVTVPSSQMQYLTSKEVGSYSTTSIYVSGLSKSSTIKSVKSSNSAVLSKYYVYYMKSTSSYETKYLESNMKKYDSKSSSNSYTARVYLKMKKAGTSTVSFKVGSKTYKTKITIKNYTNPAKSFTVTGLKQGSSSNLKSIWDKSNSASRDLTKKLSNATVKVQAKSGWKVQTLSVYNYGTGDNNRVSNYNKGFSTASVKMGNVTKDAGGSIDVDFINTKDGGYIYCYYYLY